MLVSERGLGLLSHLGSFENAMKGLCTDTGGYHYMVQYLLMSDMESTYLFHSGSIMGLVLILQLLVVYPVQPSIGFL